MNLDKNIINNIANDEENILRRFFANFILSKTIIMFVFKKIFLKIYNSMLTRSFFMLYL